MPGLALEADVNEIARLEHLLRGLGEARLVAVHRLQRHEAGQEADERERDEGRARTPVAALDECEQARDQRPVLAYERAAIGDGEARHQELRTGAKAPKRRTGGVHSADARCLGDAA
jgi:hypothetical protein